MADFSWNNSCGEFCDILKKRFQIQHSDVDIVFDPDAVIGFGKTVDMSVFIGNGCLNSGVDSQFDLIRSVFHEFRHIEQRKSNFKCCGKYASECRLDDVACRGSSLYYGAGERKVMSGSREILEPFLYTRYYRNICEIDAERYGIHEMYKFLVQNPSLYSGDLDSAFLGYINERVHKPGALQEYFLDFYEPIRSMEELDQKFELEFVDRVRSLRPGYKPAEDDVSFVGALANSDVPGWSGVFSRYQRAKDGFEERRILAGIVRAVHPEYTRNLPYSDRTAISTFRTFHMTRIPEIPESVKKRFNVLPDDERRKYYLESVNRLSQFDVPDGSPGFGPETVPDFSENFP